MSSQRGGQARYLWVASGEDVDHDWFEASSSEAAMAKAHALTLPAFDCAHTEYMWVEVWAVEDDRLVGTIVHRLDRGQDRGT